jgi:hypothetical protein
MRRIGLATNWLPDNVNDSASILSSNSNSRTFSIIALSISCSGTPMERRAKAYLSDER